MFLVKCIAIVFRYKITTNTSVYIFFIRMDLKTFKETFDDVLKEYVEQKTNQAKKLLDNSKLNNFIDYIETFIFS